MVEYSLELHTLATESGQNESALKVVFQQGLNTHVIIDLACHDDEASFNVLRDLAVWLNNLLQDCRSHLLPAPPPHFKPPGSPEPLNHASLCSTKMEFCPRKWLCVYCDEANHTIAQCTKRRSHTCIDYHPGYNATSRLPVTSATANPIILGIPWLPKHNAHISWAHKDITT